MNEYTAEKAEQLVRDLRTSGLTDDEFQRVGAMGKAYAALLREREKAQEGVTDEVVNKAFGAFLQGLKGDDGDSLKGIRAALEAVWPVRPGKTAVLDGLTFGHRAVATELLACCESWEPGVRVMGNVKASDAADLLRHFLTAVPEITFSEALNALEHFALAGNKLEGDDAKRLHASADRIAPVLQGESAFAEDVRALLECLEDEHGSDHAEADCRYCQAFDRLSCALSGTKLHTHAERPGVPLQCIWPDCGHDTNCSDPRPGCNGIGCPASRFESAAGTNDLLAVALEANDMCRSAFQVAERVATQYAAVYAGTNFGALHEQLKSSLDRQHKILSPYRKAMLAVTSQPAKDGSRHG